jgi:hyperosmotically inducible protein
MRSTRLFLVPFLLVFAAPMAFAQKHTITPAQITAEITDKLYHAQIFKHGQVQVNFGQGVATLSGTVDSVGVKMDAERAARKVDDVHQVVDNLQVNAAGVTPEQILMQARHKIRMYYAYTIFDNIDLRMQGNTLEVSGQVTQPYKKEDIGYYLSHIKGVAKLENNLDVLPVSTFDDALRISIARAIYDDPLFIYYADQALPPIHIIVKNGNVTLHGVVMSTLDKQKAADDALNVGPFFAFKNDLRVVKG